MARKSCFAVALVCVLAISLPGWSQDIPASSNPIDAVIKETNGMLDNQQLEQAKIRIDSLRGIVFNGKSPHSLAIQLKTNSLFGKYLLLEGKEEEWPDLYEWCKSQEDLCQSEEELGYLVRLFNNAGVAFKRLEQFTERDEAQLKVTETLRKMKNPDPILSGSVFSNVGNILKQRGEFERSIDYIKQSIGFFDKYVSESKTPGAESQIASRKSDAMLNLGLVYQTLGEHHEAVEIFNQCIFYKKLYNLGVQNDVYNNLVISLIEVDSLDQALQTVKTILGGYEPKSKKDLSWCWASLNLVDLKYRIAVQSHPSDLASAGSKLLQELEILQLTIHHEVSEGDDVLIVANQLASNLLLQGKQFGKALKKWADSMKILIDTEHDVSPYEIPADVKTPKSDKLIELMRLNAKIYYQWGSYLNDSIPLLEEAEKRYSFAIRLIDSLRNSLELQSSRLQVSKMQRMAYNDLIEVQYRIFSHSNNPDDIARIFTTMEQSKSATLWSSIGDMEFKTSNNIPMDELIKEKSIQNKITGVQGKIIEAKASKVPDQETIKSLENELFGYTQESDSLIRFFRNQYPDYYKTKYDRTTITLEEVGHLLEPQQLLIQYAISSDSLFTLSISQSGSKIKRSSITPEFKGDINFLLDFMKGHLESMTGNAKIRYMESASRMFDLLIGESMHIENYEELLIIPDGSLSYLPFEVLLDPRIKGYRADYRNLPYLIRNHSISYGLTATVFFYKPERTIKPSRRVLAVAPTYSMESGEISEYIRKSEAGLPELKGTLAESRSIRRMLGGKLLAGSRATESAFKRLGPKYSILHLAMHSITDNSNSLNSSLVFTPGADKREDGVLFGNEIYNLSLNARLTVLSACETGSGQMAGGEGILSFGRAFIVAGCQNLIMTMWTVDDQSSKEIMVKFYESTLSGTDVSGALQSSKISYLEEVDQLHAHPHYWAGFIELGQNQVLPLSRKRTGLFLFLTFFSITILVLVIIQTKRKKL